MRKEEAEREKERKEAAEREWARQAEAREARDIAEKEALKIKQAEDREREAQQAADREIERLEEAEREAKRRDEEDKERMRLEAERKARPPAPMLPAVTPGVVKERANWIAYVEDYKLYLQGIIDGTVPIDGMFGLAPHEGVGGISSVWLRRCARETEGNVKFPGVKCVNDKVVVT